MKTTKRNQIKTKNKKQKTKNKKQKTKKKKKGIEINKKILTLEKHKEDNMQDMIIFFILNSKIEVLTNSSAYSITIIAELDKENQISPFIKIRSDDYGIPIRKILIKFMITHDKLKGQFKLERNGRKNLDTKSCIFIQNYKSFISEVNIQKDIYYKSLVSENSLLDPICPDILYYTKHLDSNICDKILDKLDSNDKPQLEYFNNIALYGLTDKEFNNLNYEHNNIPKNSYNLSIICMELMENYQTARDIVNDNPLNLDFLMKIAKYEFKRLYEEFNYFHNDVHLDNFMINVDYPYFYDEDEDKIYNGKVIIIDFGYATQNDNSWDSDSVYLDILIRKINPEYIKNFNYEKLKQYRTAYINNFGIKKILNNLNIHRDYNFTINDIQNILKSDRHNYKVMITY